MSKRVKTNERLTRCARSSSIAFIKSSLHSCVFPQKRSCRANYSQQLNASLYVSLSRGYTPNIVRLGAQLGSALFSSNYYYSVLHAPKLSYIHKPASSFRPPAIHVRPSINENSAPALQAVIIDERSCGHISVLRASYFHNSTGPCRLVDDFLGGWLPPVGACKLLLLCSRFSRRAEAIRRESAREENLPRHLHATRVWYRGWESFCTFYHGPSTHSLTYYLRESGCMLRSAPWIMNCRAWASPGAMYHFWEVLNWRARLRNVFFFFFVCKVVASAETCREFVLLIFCSFFFGLDLLDDW